MSRPGQGPIDTIEEEKAEVRDIVKTKFVVQFAWVPVAEGDRTDDPPPADGEATPAE